MPTCGNCKEQGMTIDHIRGCFQKRLAKIEASPVQPSPFALAYIKKRRDGYVWPKPEGRNR